MSFTLLFSAVFSAVYATIQDCGKGLSLFEFRDLALKPDPPVPGAAVDMTVRFMNPGTTVNDGTVTTSVTINFIPFAPSTEALCANTKCPIVSGVNDRSTSSTTPTSIQGKISTKIVWNALNGSELLCISSSFSLPYLYLHGTKFLRGSHTILDYRHAKYIASMFRKRRVLQYHATRMNLTSSGSASSASSTSSENSTTYGYTNTSLVVYKAFRVYYNPMCPTMSMALIVYNWFNDHCGLDDNLLEVSTMEYPLVLWRPNNLNKLNALRSSSF